MRSDAPEDEARRLVRKYVTAWNSHDVGRLLSLFAEDGSYGEFGLGRIMLGQEEIRRYLIATFAALDAVYVDVEREQVVAVQPKADFLPLLAAASPTWGLAGKSLLHGDPEGLGANM